PAPVAPAATVAAATAPDGQLASKLDGLGLSSAQVDAVLALSREVIEQVVWEVVPDLAETLIREEIARLMREA
ncbi:MAG: response regulator, partial [Myxococcales bacterium]|nr:response regulator [Myxococcales bacterium]